MPRSSRLLVPLLTATLAAAPASAQMMKSPDAVPERAAPEKGAPQSKGQVQLSFAPVVKRAAPSVVNVYASHVEPRGQSRSAMDEFMRRFFGENGGGRGRGGAPGERLGDAIRDQTIRDRFRFQSCAVLAAYIPHGLQDRHQEASKQLQTTSKY